MNIFYYFSIFSFLSLYPYISLSLTPDLSDFPFFLFVPNHYAKVVREVIFAFFEKI